MSGRAEDEMSSFGGFVLGLNPITFSPHVSYSLQYQNFLSIGTRMWWVFQAEAADLMTHVGFSCIACPSDLGTDIRVGLQHLDVNGEPDGTWLTQCVFSPSNDDNNHFVWKQLATTYLTYRGEPLAEVLELVGPTMTPNRLFRVNSHIEGACWRRGFPHAGLDYSGREKIGWLPVYGYKSATKVYGMPIQSRNIDTYAHPRERGMRFTMDEDWCESFTVAGVEILFQGEFEPSHNFDIVLYEGGTVRQRLEFDADIRSYTGTYGLNSWLGRFYFDESTLPILYSGTEYFIALSPRESNGLVTLTTLVFESQEDLAALPGGANFHGGEREGGSGTSHPEWAPMMDLIIDQWNAPGPPQEGMHVKFLPRYNDNMFIEHADDQINSGTTLDEDYGPHEQTGYVIGDAIKPYGGFRTVEVFKDPDAGFSPEYVLFAERAIEELKMVNWTDLVAGSYRLVFRLRTAEGSEYYTDVEQFITVL